MLVVLRQSKPTAGASIWLVSVNRPGNCQEVGDLGQAGFGYYGINPYGLDRYQPRSWVPVQALRHRDCRPRC